MIKVRRGIKSELTWSALSCTFENTPILTIKGDNWVSVSAFGFVVVGFEVSLPIVTGVLLIVWL